MGSRVWLLIAAAGVATAADLGPDLLTAAKKGQAAQVRALADRRAPLEARDKDRRTPLILAAQRGHAAVVKLLLERGADAAARDREGWTAYGLALTSSSAGRDEVLKLLPPPPRQRVTLDVQLAPDNLYSSCSMTPRQLAQFLSQVRPDAMVLDAVRAAAASPGVPAASIPIELVPGNGDAVAMLKVRPQVSCVQQQNADNLSLAIDLRVTLAGRDSPILEKTFGGGLKGLHARRATSPAQYPALFADWAKAHAGGIYWSVLTALLKAS
jgi:hypothetical protein